MSPRSGPKRRSGKFAPVQAINANRGVNAVERVVLNELHYVWRPRATLDVGLDGDIEIRDPDSSEMSGWIIAVQVKAIQHGDSPGDTFTYSCDERDLDYWLHTNLPVILTVVHLDRDEVYWADIKSRFADPAARKSRKIQFSRTRDRLGAHSASALIQLARPKNSGFYLPVLAKSEDIVSNLLPVEVLPQSICLAPTDFKTTADLWRHVRANNINIKREVFVKGGILYSIHELAEEPWAAVCQGEARERIDFSEWSESDDLDTQRDAVRLLNLVLQSHARNLGIYYQRTDDLFFVPATHDLQDRSKRFHFQNRSRRRVVFSTYPRRDDPQQVSYCRHAAFSGEFVRQLDRTWCLVINPTWYFTRDGRQPDPYGESRLSGIKRFDRHPGVFAYLVMWADWLSKPADLLSGTPALQFGSLLRAKINVGIHDPDWQTTEDPDERDLQSVSDNQLL